MGAMDCGLSGALGGIGGGVTDFIDRETQLAGDGTGQVSC